MVLVQEAFDRARSFIKANARPLETVRFAFHFDGTPADDVVKQLKKFQNSDGGFGNAIEPDLRAPESSALGTSIAFQIMREIGKSNRTAIASAGIRYLLGSVDDTKSTWRIIPKSAESSPHAPWWTQTGRDEKFGYFSLNPTAELLGYLLENRDDVPSSLLSALSQRILSYLDVLDGIEMHDFLCCKRLAETDGLDASFKEKLEEILDRLLSKTVSQDPSQWEEYGLMPIQVADRPESAFFEVLRDTVSENLDYEISVQQEDGSWTPTWSWGDKHPDVWEKAKLEWAGVLTVDRLITMKRYGRIEGMA